MSTLADADDARQQRKREAARLRKQQWRSNPANAEAVTAETEAARVWMQERRTDPAFAEAERLRQQLPNQVFKNLIVCYKASGCLTLKYVRIYTETSPPAALALAP
jgi:hypothetical protein